MSYRSEWDRFTIQVVGHTTDDVIERITLVFPPCSLNPVSDLLGQLRTSPKITDDRGFFF